MGKLVYIYRNQNIYNLNVEENIITVEDRSDYIFKIVLLGEGAVGKTSIRRSYMGKNFIKPHLMTLGADFSQKKIILNNKNIQFQIWDIAGQDNFKNVRARFLNNANGVFMVYDLSRIETFYAISKWLKELWSVNNRTDIPVLVVGNKLDLMKKRFPDENRIAQGLNHLQKYLNNNSYIGHIQTSAKTGVNIEHSFKMIAENLMTSTI